MSETGPIYGVELIDSLPLNPGKDSRMRQAMPSRDDLECSRRLAYGDRVAAGYEVLLNHWREQIAMMGRLVNSAFGSSEWGEAMNEMGEYVTQRKQGDG